MTKHYEVFRAGATTGKTVLSMDQSSLERLSKGDFRIHWQGASWLKRCETVSIRDDGGYGKKLMRIELDGGAALEIPVEVQSWNNIPMWLHGELRSHLGVYVFAMSQGATDAGLKKTCARIWLFMYRPGSASSSRPPAFDFRETGKPEPMRVVACGVGPEDADTSTREQVIADRNLEEDEAEGYHED